MMGFAGRNERVNLLSQDMVLFRQRHQVSTTIQGLGPTNGFLQTNADTILCHGLCCTVLWLLLEKVVSVLRALAAEKNTRKPIR